MKLCIFTSSFPRSEQDEASIFIGRLAAAIAAHAEETRVIVPRDRLEPLEERRGNIEILRYRYGLFSRGRLAFGAGLLPTLQSQPWLILQMPLLILRMVQRAWPIRASIDVVHANWIVAGIAAWLFSLLCGKPYVLTLRGSDMKLVDHPIAALIYRPVIKRASMLTVVSQHFRQIVCDKFGLAPARVVWLPNGVDIAMPGEDQFADFLERRNLRRDGRYLLTVSSVIPLKRIELPIRLIAEPGLSDYELLVCGRTEEPEYLRQLQDLSVSLGVSGRVHFIGAVPPAEIPCFLRAARYFVSASSFEGRPNSVLEALAARTPVLLSDIPAHREIVADGESGIIFDAGNLPAVAERLAALDADPERLARLTTAGAGSIRDYGWDACARRYIEIFEGVSR